jgi:hypothetical protein
LAQGLLKDLAAPPVALPLDEVGLDGNRSNHPPVLRGWGGLLHHGRALGRTRLATHRAAHLSNPRLTLGQGPKYSRLVGIPYLPLNDRFVIDGQDGMRPDLVRHDGALRPAEAVHQYISPAEIGQNGQVATDLFQACSIFFCQTPALLNNTVHVFLSSEKTPARSCPRRG